MVLTEPTEGNDAEFNDYYENTHLDEVIETAGYGSAQRFKLVTEMGEQCPLPYLAVYEAEGESGDEVLQRLNDSRGNREQSDALNRRTGRIWIYEQLGPRHS